MLARNIGRWCLAVILLAVFSCSGNRTAELDAPVGPQFNGLPGLDSLPVPQAAHTVSAAAYSLLLLDPIAGTGGGSVDHAGGDVTLDPAANGGIAWAVYALAGFPGDGSVFPEGINVSKGMAGVWAGYSNYASGTWEFLNFQNSGYLECPGGADLPSGDGVFYVLVVAVDAAVTVYDLDVRVSDDLPGAPNAHVELIGMAAAGLQASFSAAGSDGGDGTITELTWTFDGGNEYVSADVNETVTHTFATAGPHTVNLVVRNDLARTGSGQLNVDVVEPFRELLVLYNSDVPESQDLAEYYASSATGRSIDPDYVLGLSMGTNENQITRENYNSWVRDPLKAHLDSSGYKNTIKYICTVKGVPFQITTDGHGGFDSDLCMLYEDGNYDYTQKLFSGNDYPAHTGHFNNSQFYEALDGANKSFAPFTYTACDTDGTDYTVSYLVGRISAYTYEDAKLSIDRSLSADTSGTGWVTMDTHAGWQGNDTMADPVWPWATAPERKCLKELLDDAGYNNHLDLEYSVLLSDGMPAGAKDAIIGFAGWGVNHARNDGDQYPSGRLYILQDLDDLTYLPGAAWIVYESYAAQSFSWDGTPEDHHGSQGQICDFIRMGGTVATGNCYEPLTDGIPDERRVMERYLLKGDRWIEACYKGVRYFSWHTIVLGDPLCRVVAD